MAVLLRDLQQLDSSRACAVTCSWQTLTPINNPIDTVSSLNKSKSQLRNHAVPVSVSNDGVVLDPILPSSQLPVTGSILSPPQMICSRSQNPSPPPTGQREK